MESLANCPERVLVYTSRLSLVAVLDTLTLLGHALLPKFGPKCAISYQMPHNNTRQQILQCGIFRANLSSIFDCELILTDVDMVWYGMVCPHLPNGKGSLQGSDNFRKIAASVAFAGC